MHPREPKRTFLYSSNRQTRSRCDCSVLQGLCEPVLNTVNIAEALTPTGLIDLYGWAPPPPLPSRSAAAPRDHVTSSAGRAAHSRGVGTFAVWHVPTARAAGGDRSNMFHNVPDGGFRRKVVGGAMLEVSGEGAAVFLSGGVRGMDGGCLVRKWASWFSGGGVWTREGLRLCWGIQTEYICTYCQVVGSKPAGQPVMSGVPYLKLAAPRLLYALHCPV